MKLTIDSSPMTNKNGKRLDRRVAQATQLWDFFDQSYKINPEECFSLRKWGIFQANTNLVLNAQKKLVANLHGLLTLAISIIEKARLCFWARSLVLWYTM